MKNIITIIIAVALLAPFPLVASDLTNKDLMNVCANKTIVMGRDDGKKMVQIGKKMDGFCIGYLQATFNALKNMGTCKEIDTNPEYLRSIYLQYIKDKKIPENESASKTLIHAFRRATECE